ncbi:MAG: hypothetical protein QF815_01280 [Candidatus Peribacteraceae bacterium]|jgi:hypothetical protein|nr:hypothetical protein [Candidatus Peribacteraceae bacterium]MDP7476953.1 hypothetical protein [Candidatus Peribacteraceae bacterium]
MTTLQAEPVESIALDPIDGLSDTQRLELHARLLSHHSDGLNVRAGLLHELDPKLICITALDVAQQIASLTKNEREFVVHGLKRDLPNL